MLALWATPLEPPTCPTSGRCWAIVAAAFVVRPIPYCKRLLPALAQCLGQPQFMAAAVRIKAEAPLPDRCQTLERSRLPGKCATVAPAELSCKFRSLCSSRLHYKSRCYTHIISMICHVIRHSPTPSPPLWLLTRTCSASAAQCVPRRSRCSRVAVLEASSRRHGCLGQ